MSKETKSFLGACSIELIILGIFLMLSRGYNALWNNRYFETKSSQTNSYSTGIFGHNEYTEYIDNSVDLKVYPKLLGHRLESSRLVQDLDGDGLSDKIR